MEGKHGWQAPLPSYPTALQAEQSASKLADLYLERLIDPGRASEELLGLLEPGLDQMIGSLLRRRCLLFDPQTMKGFALVTALLDLAQWDRSLPFLNWLESRLELRLEEVDKGLGIDWLELQEQFHGSRLWDERTARYVRAVHQLPEPARRLYLHMLVEGIPLAQVARMAGLSPQQAEQRARESAELVLRWIRLEEQCDGS